MTLSNVDLYTNYTWNRTHHNHTSGEQEPDENALMCFEFQFRIHSFTRYYMLAIIVVGLLGNCLSALTFMCTKLRRAASSHYLTALAFADSGMLLSNVMLMIKTYPDVPGMCQLVMYCGGVFSFISVWYVVSFTCERYIAVKYPLQRLQWCTVRRARYTVAGVAALACIFNSHLLLSAQAVSRELSETQNVTICDVREQFLDAASIMNHLDTALTFVVPLILIILLNAAIAASTWCTNRRSNRKTSSGSYYLASHGQRRGTLDDAAASTTGALLLSAAGETFLGGDSKRYIRKRLADDRRMTRMLFVVSFLFVVLSLPDYVVRMCIYTLMNTDAWANMSVYDRCRFFCAQNMTTLLFNTNFAVNFFLYSLVGANFRTHLKGLASRLLVWLCVKADYVCKLRRYPAWARFVYAMSEEAGTRRQSTASVKNERLSRLPSNGFGVVMTNGREHAYSVTPSPSPLRLKTRRSTLATTASLRSVPSLAGKNGQYSESGQHASLIAKQSIPISVYASAGEETREDEECFR